MKSIVLLALSLLFAPLAFGQGGPPGPIKATTKVLPDGSTATTVVNPDTRTAEETYSDAAGKMIKKTVFTLDENQIVTSATRFDSKGKIRYKEKFKLDGANRVSESSLFSAADQPLGRRVFVYDSKGAFRVEDYDAAGRLIPQAAPASTSRGTKSPTVRRGQPVR